MVPLQVACGGSSPPPPAPSPEIPIAPPDSTSEPPPLPPRVLPTCVVRGDGQGAASESWILVHGSEGLTDPWVEIATSSGLVFSWTIDSAPSRPALHVAIGKQKTARLDGWAKQPRLDLWFRQDTALVDERVFARKGDTIDAFVRSEGELLRVAQNVYLVSPKTIEANTPCRGLRWGRVTADGALKVTGRSRGVVDKHLSLFREPDTKEALDLRFEDDFTVYELEARGDWVKINFDAGPVFQGWVKGTSLGDPPPTGGRGGSGHRSRAPRLRFTKRLLKIAEVERDTPLYVGKSGAEVQEIGIVEEGAVVRVVSSNGKLTAFQFDHGYVHAPEGLELYLDPKDLGNVHEEDRGGSWTPPPLPSVNEEEAD